MTWTFEGAISTDRYRVRLLIGDTDATDQLLSDEALAFLLSAVPPAGADLVVATAAAACRAIAARFARRVDFDQGGLSIQASQRAARYSALAAELQSRVDAAVAAKAAGGGFSMGRPGSLGRPSVGGVPEVVDLRAARRNRPQDPTGAPLDPWLDPVTGAPRSFG